jgi:hypothetical protein
LIPIFTRYIVRKRDGTYLFCLPKIINLQKLFITGKEGFAYGNFFRCEWGFRAVSWGQFDLRQFDDFVCFFEHRKNKVAVLFVTLISQCAEWQTGNRFDVPFQNLLI